MVTPHVAFLEDLDQWLQEILTPQMEVMIYLDANEQWTQDAAITTFSNSFNLMNVNDEMKLHPTHPNISNLDNSTTIDYCLCSREIVKYITYAASAPYDLESYGDHRGITVDINLGKFLGETSAEDEMKTRKLTLSDPKSVEKYLETVEKKFDHQNIY